MKKLILILMLVAVSAVPVQAAWNDTWTDGQVIYASDWNAVISILNSVYLTLISVQASTTSGANVTVPDGGNITHSLASTPVWCIPAPSVAGEVVGVTAIGSSNFTVSIKNASTMAAGTTQTIYWRCGI